MFPDLAAVAAVCWTPTEIAGDFDGTALRRIFTAAEGRLLADQSTFQLAEFADARAALTTAIGIQQKFSGRFRSGAGLRAAVNHRDRQQVGQPATNGEISDIHNLLSRSEVGGICLARTVYDAVRGEVELAYDTRPNTADVYYSCAMMRQNAHKIDLFGNSAVPIPAAAIRDQGAKRAEAPDVASPGNRLFQVVDRWMSVLERN